MGVRFLRRIRIAPGIRLNVGLGGPSLSIGPRGASVTVGNRGIYRNVGIPGTGISTRSRIGQGVTSSGANRSEAGGSGRSAISISLNDEGNLSFTNSDGQPASLGDVRKIKREKRGDIEAFVSSACEAYNRDLEILKSIHVTTPRPCPRALFQDDSFESPIPVPPKPIAYSLIGRFFQRHRNRIDAMNREALAEHDNEAHAWNEAKDAHRIATTLRRTLYDAAGLPGASIGALTEYFESVLLAYEWPRETLIDFQFSPDGRSLYLDVDLPEIEDMPRKELTPAGMNGVRYKELSDKAVRETYMRHVHGVGFRLAGEAFAAVPPLGMLIISAYTQRVDRSIGNEVDEYLYSIRIPRAQWETLGFDRLADIDPVEALARFELRRSMSKTGVFKKVDPFGV